MGRGLTTVLVLAAAISGPPAQARAKDLGALGATFPIVEQDLLAVLAAKLRAFERSGKLESLNKAFQARVKAKLSRPTPVAGLTTTDRARSWLFDPSITVPRDFADQNGRVFARKGAVINPLDRLPTYNRVLVFVDGDDAEQVRFAVRRARKDPREKVYIVLTSGAPIELMRSQKVEMFFDQDGSLVRRFGLTHVPAVVEREGRALRVSEVRP
jgi:conjugal transfer pilus assembly protein TraW